MNIEEFIRIMVGQVMTQEIADTMITMVEEYGWEQYQKGIDDESYSQAMSYVGFI